MRKIPTTILLCLLTASWIQGQTKTQRSKPSPKTLTLPQAVKVLEPSIVQIQGVLYGPGSGGSLTMLKVVVLGSGFMVHPSGIVVTALHVIQPKLPQGVPRIELFVGIPYANSKTSGITVVGNFQGIDFELVDKDERHDLALLKMKTTQPMNVMKVNGTMPKLVMEVAASLTNEKIEEGLPVAVSGYPLSSSVLVTTSGRLAASWASEIELGGYVADIHVNAGNSGAPTYLVESGKVIGVCVGFKPASLKDANETDVPFFYNSGLAIIAPIKYVLQLMEKNKIPTR